MGNLLPVRMLRDYEYRAYCEKQAGATIKIHKQLGTIAITMSSGTEYFFDRDEDYDYLIDQVPDNIIAEDFILAIAQGW